MSYKFPEFQSLKTVDGVISDLNFVNRDLLISIEGDSKVYLLKNRFGGKEKLKKFLGSGSKLNASMLVDSNDKKGNNEVYALKINGYGLSSYENNKLLHTKWKSGVNYLSFIIFCVGIVGFVFGDVLAKKYKELG